MNRLSRFLLLAALALMLTGMVDPGRVETTPRHCVVIERQWTPVYEGGDYRIWEVRALCLEEL